MSVSINQYHIPSRQIYLNSKYATLIEDQSKRSHCWFQFNEPLRIPKNYDVLISLTDAIIPVSWYVVDSTNNQFTVMFTNVINQSYTFTLPTGNLSASTIANFLTTTLTFGDKVVNFTCLFDASRNKFEFRANRQFRISQQSTLLGFSGAVINAVSVDQYVGLVNTPYWTISSDNSIDLSGTRAIFVKSSFVTSSLDSKTKGNSGILGKVNIDVGFNELQHYRNDVGYKTKVATKNISVIEISLLDETHEYVNFNGVDWSMTLTVDILGKSPEDYMPDVPEQSLFSGASV